MSEADLPKYEDEVIARIKGSNNQSQPAQSMSNEELLPCPFCEGTTLFTDSSGHELYNTCCDLCGACGSVATTELEAKKLWNTRPDSKPYKYTTHSEWFAIFKSCFKDIDESDAGQIWLSARERKEG